MAKIRKAQGGERVKSEPRSPMDPREDRIKKRIESAKNPLFKYTGGPSKKTMLSTKKYPVDVAIDTTGYAAGTKNAFPFSSELLVNKPGRKNPAMWGVTSRKYVEKKLKQHSKKTGGRVSKKK